MTTVSLVLFYPNYDPFKNIFYNLKSRYCLPLQKLVNHQIKLETKYWSLILSQRGKYFNAILLGHNFNHLFPNVDHYLIVSWQIPSSQWSRKYCDSWSAYCSPGYWQQNISHKNILCSIVIAWFNYIWILLLLIRLMCAH